LWHAIRDDGRRSHRVGDNDDRPGEPKYTFSPSSESWLKVEFEQNFIQLRDRDDKILGLTKFYVSAMLGVGSVAIGLLGLEKLGHPYTLVGMLLLGACILGEMFFVWMVAFRGYFVECARQINAIRRAYRDSLPAGLSWCVLQPTDPAVPRTLNRRSGHIVVMALMSFVNACLAGIGLFGVTAATKILTARERVGTSAAAFLLVLVVNEAYVRTRFARKIRA
jgi:hypothetical protein